VRSIAEHKDRADGGLRWGVESICRVLSEHGAATAPSSYHEALSRPPSKRALRDDALRAEITRVHETNYGVHGPRKIWLALNREGIPVARCTVERLMRDPGMVGVRRGKRVITTRFDGGADRPADLVQRQFRACRAEPLVGGGLHLRLDVVWDGLSRVRHRRLRPSHPRLLSGDQYAHRTGARCDRAGDLDSAREGVIDLAGLSHHHDNGPQAGSNWSSQHLDRGGVDGQAGGVDEGADWTFTDEVAGGAVASAGGRAPVLA
jgi:putative transposase